MSRALILGSSFPTAGLALEVLSDIPDMTHIVASREDPKFIIYNSKVFDRYGEEIQNRDYFDLYRFNADLNPNLLHVDLSRDSLGKIINLDDIDVVINTGVITDSYFIHANPETAMKFSADSVNNILVDLKKANAHPLFIDFSNTHIYDGQPYPKDKGYTEDIDVSKPRSYRAKILHRHENVVNKLAKEAKIPYMIWRISTLLGENTSRSTFPSRVAMAIFNHLDIEINGTGQISRDYCNSKYLGICLKETVKNYLANPKDFTENHSGKTYNFSMGEPNKTPIRVICNSMFSLLKEFRKETGWVMPEITTTPWRFSKKEEFDIWVNTDKAIKELPYNVKRPTSMLLASHLIYIADRFSTISEDNFKTLTKWLIASD